MLRIQDCALGETLHEGPETTVRRVTHGPSGERFIVKMQVRGTPSPRSLGRLIHEHRILVKLAEVPGVIRARALEQESGHAALWLEEPGWRSLDRMIAAQGRLPVATALRIAFEVSRVLQGVHAARVVHKDIKPQNILWDEGSGRVTLLDFSIASELAEEATEASIPEALEGTLAYLSPEQTGRTARGLDARTDLYSLGVVLFEMLAGRRPFLEIDALALVHAHLAKAPPALESLVPGVPGVVARIVERCLEKHPEQRYQTARGLSADLSECLRQLEARESIELFPLGQKDFSSTLRIPQALLSREKETQEITAAFERAAGGAVEVLLLGGPSGVGKTALVRSVYREIARAGRGLLLSGKHDQLGRAVPYAALAQSFGGLLRNLAASPKPVFDAWRARIDRALGPLSRVIADLVPELEWLMGPLPPVPVVPTEMTYNRLKLSWIEFVRAVTDASPPLVLFLDDMQWVDPASLELLKTLLTDVGRKHLLIIAAYRDNEAEPGHPLWGLVEAVTTSGVRTPRLSVGPLDEASVQRWLAAALSSEPPRVAPLARALWSKTHGNPFYLGQLLLELYRQKRVRRNLEDGAWEWDQDAALRAAVTENVVELMRRKVVELPAETQALLGQAACAGHSFSLAELAVLAGLGQAQVVQDLRPALLAGLVIPQDGQYREAQALAQVEGSGEMDAGYRFLHDRVQQAFYERIAKEQRARTHLLIGRRLQAVFEQEGGSNQKLLELSRHLNLGAEALSSEAERKELARLDLRAAKAAKANGSYRLQATLVEQAQGLLGECAWQEEPELSVELALERIEADFMLKEFDEVHRRAQELLALPLPALPRLSAQALRMRAYEASGQYGEGERLGSAALAEQGITYPGSNDECVELALRWMAECDAWLDRRPEGFSLLPADPSVERLCCDTVEALLMNCAAYGNRPALAALVLARNIKQATERESLTPVTPFLIGALGNARAGFSGDYRGSVRWVREGEMAAARLSSPFFPECAFFRIMYASYEHHAERAREHYRATLRTALASGSFGGTSWVLVGELYCVDVWGGRPLGQVAEKEQAHRDMMTRAGNVFGQHVFALLASYAAFLRASQPARSAPGEEWLTVNSRFLVGIGSVNVAAYARILEAHLFLAFGAWTRALERAEEAECFRTALFGNTPVTDIPLWLGLAAARCWSPSLDEGERTALLAKMEHAIERFRYFSEGCAENFLHKLRLLEAEHARIHGKTDEAMASYDEAITLARKEGFLQIEALAAQLCAEYHLQAGRERIGALYLHEARDAYFRWDALALVAHLEAKYPTLLKAPLAMAATDTAGGLQLDVNTAVRAAQALSSELDPDRVVGRLMELLLANAGAQRGTLVLAEEDALVVTARLSVEDARIETGLSEPLAQCRDVAGKVIRYAARSREPVVVNDASSERRFDDDPYLATHTVRSLLALPLTHRGRLGGVLYLEHRDAPSAFPPSRVELLSVLASQAAIAVENANLYRSVEAQVRELQARNREIQQLNDELRRQIAQRSRRLMEALLSQDASPAISARLDIGSLLGDCYRVLRPLGMGGMGAVYEVERTTDGVHFAAKVLHHVPDRSDLGRFAREAQILARVSHPNLISIFDVDVTDEGALYIIMELVSGGASLRQIDARTGDVPWNLCVLRQVAEALAALHAQSIVHRDLKPENILIVSDRGAAPVVKVADFGISIVLDEAPKKGSSAAPPPRTSDTSTAEVDIGPGHVVTMTLRTSSPLAETLGAVGASSEGMERRGPMFTETGVLIGTPLYMAPELVRGSRSAQPPSDTFSLGVIAYELLVGTTPFSSPPILLGLSSDTLPVPTGLRQCPGLPAELARLFERCLDMDPAKRPAASEIAALFAQARREPATGMSRAG
jgi:serine/threonine protein kinase